MITLKRKDWIENELLEVLGSYDTATLYEANGRKGALKSIIRPLNKTMKICGRALTVEPGLKDNLMVLKAMDMSREDDVIIVDGKGETEVGYIGDMMVTQAKCNNISGFVIYGGVRDIDKIEEIGLPVFSTGVCLIGPTKEVMGSINQPILIGEIKIYPGDIIVGDSDGVVVISVKDAATTAEKARIRSEKETEVLENIHNGKSMFNIMGYREELEALGYKD